MAARPEIVKEYEETEKEYMKIYEQYCDQMEKLTKQMEALTCRRAYGKEGTLHRGYYCPSPIHEIVIGNCKRGRLLTKLRKNSTYDFEYCFDKEDRLILIKDYANEISKGYHVSSEVLLYSGDCVLGLEYGVSLAQLDHISRCFYSGDGIKRYETVSILHYEDEVACSDIQTETYMYEGSQLRSGRMEGYDFIMNFLSGEMKYDFHYDEAGDMDSYVATEYRDREERLDVYNRGHVYEVKKPGVKGKKDIVAAESRITNTGGDCGSTKCGAIDFHGW